MSEKNTGEDLVKIWARGWVSLLAAPARLFYTVTRDVERS